MKKKELKKLALQPSVIARIDVKILKNLQGGRSGSTYSNFCEITLCPYNC